MKSKIKKVKVVALVILLIFSQALFACGKKQEYVKDVVYRIDMYDISKTEQFDNCIINFSTDITFDAPCTLEMQLSEIIDSTKALASVSFDIGIGQALGINLIFDSGIIDNPKNYLIKIFAFKNSDKLEQLNGYTEIQSLVSELKNVVPINIDRDYEYKDIESVEVLKKENQNVVNLKSLSNTDLLEKDNLLVRVKMKGTQSIYSTIKSYKKANNYYNLQLDIKDTVSYNGEKAELVNINFPSETKSLLIDLVNQIKADPKGVYALNADVDGSGFSGNYIIDSFQGILTGNGYKIYNLSAPLFNKVNAASIKSLELENVAIQTSADYNAALCNEATNSTFTDVHINGFKYNNSKFNNRYGGAIAAVATNCVITDSSVNAVNYSTSLGTIGGVVGYLKGGKIENCYAEGKIGSLSNTSNLKVGGLVGRADNNAVINNCIANVDITLSLDLLQNVGGFIGYALQDTVSGSGNMSLGNMIAVNNVNAKADKFIGNNVFGIFTNCYESSSASGSSNENANHIISVSDKQLEAKSFYDTMLKIDESLWNIGGVKLGILPHLYSSPVKTVMANGGFLPDIDRLLKCEGFDAERIVAYENVFKLMPYFDAKHIIEDGNKIPLDHELNFKVIDSILPTINKDYAVSINSENQSRVNQILVKYVDNSIKSFNIVKPTLKNGILHYAISGTGLIYSYGYVLDIHSDEVSYAVKKVKALNLKTDLFPIIGGEYIEINAYPGFNASMSRDSDRYMLEKKYEDIQENIESYVYNLMGSYDNWNVYLKNEVFTDYFKADFENYYKKNLLSYTYIQRWYDIKIGGITLSDMLFFNGGYYGDFDFKYLSDMIAGDAVSKDLRSAGKTYDLYSNVIKNKMTISLPSISKFIEYHISTYGGTTDYDQWFADNFKGILSENGVDNPNINYRAWYSIKTGNSGDNFILPLLSFMATDESDDMYIISMPSQFIFGSLSSYSTYFEENGREKMIKRIMDFGKQCGELYNTTSKFIDGAETRLNKIHQFQIDSPKYNGSHQQACSSDVPTLREFYNAMGYGKGNNGSGAFANGYYVVWVVYSAVGDFSTFTHETTHNQDGSYFLEGQGRRENAWAEDFAAGIFEHSHGDNAVAYNFGKKYLPSDNVASNLSPERVAGKDKIQDFYHKYYETLYAIDLMELEAMLSLDKKTQSKLMLQHNYGFADDKVSVAYNRSIWNYAPDFESLNIENYSELIDNRMNISRDFTPGGQINGANDYGNTSINTAYFYQAYNPYGRADKFAFKRFSFELVGEYGWTDGAVKFLSYYGGSNDLDVMRKITKDPNMTMEKWKKSQYSKVEKTLNSGEDEKPYFYKKDIVDLFRNAYMTEASIGDAVSKPLSGRLRTNLLKYILRQTNDFETGAFETAKYTDVDSAQKLVDGIKKNPNGGFRLTKNLDFKGIEVDENSKTVIGGNFTGRLNGNGYAIKNLNKTLFNNVIFGHVENIKFESANITLNENNNGILARTANMAFFTDITVEKSTVKGNGYLGSIVGKADNSAFNRIGANAEVIGNSGYVGGISGQINNCIVNNSYFSGYIKGVGDSVGGFVGRVDNSAVSNSYAKVKILQTNGNRRGGGFSGGTYNSSNVRNCVAFTTNEAGGYSNRFEGTAVRNALLTRLYNCYEYSDSNSNTNIVEFVNDGITINTYKGILESLTPQQATGKDFYKQILRFDESIWDLSNVSNALPTLKKR